MFNLFFNFKIELFIKFKNVANREKKQNFDVDQFVLYQIQLNNFATMFKKIRRIKFIVE